MNAKERLCRAIAGEPTDLVAVAPAYLGLYLDDVIHKYYLEQYERKLAGRKACPIDHAEDSRFRAEAIRRAYRTFQEPPDWMNVRIGPSKEWAERGEIQLLDGRCYYVDTTTGEREDILEVQEVLSPKSVRYTRRSRTSKQDLWDGSEDLHTCADVDAIAPVRTVEELEAQGVYEVARILVQEWGDEMFIEVSSGTPFWSTYNMLGFNGMMVMMQDKPDLFRYLMDRKHQQRLELLKGFARAGVHGTWIEECLSSADLISPRTYEEFAFPTTLAYVADVNRLGLVSVFYYCGDVIPRLPWLKRLGAAAVAVEESKKGFSIEIADVIAGLEGTCCVFGNVDAVEVVQQGTPEEIEAEVQRQIQLGKRAKGFVLCQGSPFPLDTDPRNVDLFTRAARQTTVAGPERRH